MVPILDSPKITTAHKYNAVAGYFGLYDLLFFYPRRFRSKGADALGDIKDKRVLEIGCGNGLNFKHLVERVGPDGAVVGIDLSVDMVGAAQSRCKQNSWHNVSTHISDAAEYLSGTPLDAAYFGLSFTVIDNPYKALDNILNQLRSGGRIAVMETRIPNWMPPFLERRLSKYAHRNFGTDVEIKPWRVFEEYQQRGLIKNVTVETIRNYSFYVLSAEKT